MDQSISVGDDTSSNSLFWCQAIENEIKAQAQHTQLPPLSQNPMDLVNAINGNSLNLQELNKSLSLNSATSRPESLYNDNSFSFSLNPMTPAISNTTITPNIQNLFAFPAAAQINTGNVMQENVSNIITQPLNRCTLNTGNLTVNNRANDAVLSNESCRSIVVNFLTAYYHTLRANPAQITMRSEEH
eukprot:105640_1